MRIVQLIDSLNTGGAEKMAINFANSLNKKIDFSGIVATRQQGNLFALIELKEHYCFLNKKNAIDFNAVSSLKKYCKKNNIHFVHAHTTSFFTAFLLKVFYFKIKIIYHEHTGSRSNESIFRNKLLFFCLLFFDGIITVNQELKNYYKSKFYFKKIIYLNNYVSENSKNIEKTDLYGNHDKRILYLANLRNPKNHLLLVEIAAIVLKKHADWTFHLVGTDFNDAYSNDIKHAIISNNLQKNIFIYGLKNDIANIINQAEICVITSNSEGLPVSFLEYGINKKPVVSTKVGEISKIIENHKNGILVPVKSANLFADELLKLIENKNLRLNLGQNLFETIAAKNSESIVINQYINWIKEL